MGKTSKIKIGDEFSTNHNGVVSVVSYINKSDVQVRFSDGTTTSVRAENLRKGIVFNPFQPTYFGVGFIGVGPYKPTSSGKKSKSHNVWSDMLRRCYDKDRQAKISAAYIGCSVVNEWHNYQNFAEWYELSAKGRDYLELDKDLLVKGNKVYGPDFCELVPPEINRMMSARKSKRGEFPIGVCYHKKSSRWIASMGGSDKYIGLFSSPEQAFFAYKNAKESRIKTAAEKYKSEISLEMYNCLSNYSVNIND